MAAWSSGLASARELMGHKIVSGQGIGLKIFKMNNLFFTILFNDKNFFRRVQTNFTYQSTYICTYVHTYIHTLAKNHCNGFTMVSALLITAVKNNSVPELARPDLS
jgi:hypothetical protein